MLNNKLFFVLVLLFGIHNSYGQTTCGYTLSGRIIDEHDKSSLAFASIYIKELERGAISDKDGNYTIKNLCKGTYNIVVNHIGCEPVKETITLTKDLTYHFYPEHHAEELKEFSIAEKRSQEDVSMIKRKLSAKEINQSRGKSLGESLKKITGVTSLSTGSNIAKPVIHGLHSDRILILNNGIRQESQQWGSEHAPEIDPYIADQLSVIKGAEGIRYGANAIAGVVLVEPRALRDTNGIDGEVNLAGASNGRLGVASAMLNGNIGRLNGLSWRLQGTLKKAGNVAAPNYFLKNTGVEEYNFSWAAAYDKEKFGIATFYSQFNSNIGIFSAAHIGNLTDLQRAIDADVPLELADFTYEINRPFQHIEHELFKVKSYIKTGDNGKLSFVYARQYNLREEYDKDLPRNDSVAALNLPELQFEITTHTGKLTWVQDQTKKLNSQLGISGIHQANTVEGREFIPAFIKYGTGLFFIEKWRSANFKWKLESGIRYDYIYQRAYIWNGSFYDRPTYTYHNVSGSLGASHKLTNQLTARLNLGMAFRPPNVSELFSDGLHHGAAAVENGDTSLIAERAYSSILAIDYVATNFTLQAEVYHNYINNFIYLQPVLPATLTIRGAFPTFNYTQVDAVFTGVDLKTTYQFYRNLKWTGKIAFINAHNSTFGEPLVGIPSNRLENELEYSIAQFKRLKSIYVGLGSEHVLRQYRVPENSDYLEPPNGYNVFHFNAGFSIPTYKKQRLVVDIEINNLFNTVYRDYLNRFRYFTDELGRNYNIKFKLTF